MSDTHQQAAAQTTYRLHSSPMQHTPGVIAWAINGYAFPKDRSMLIKVIKAGFAGVPTFAIQQLLSGAVGHTVEGDVVVFTVDTPPEQRFNSLGNDQTLDRFEWFELVACRHDESEGGIVQCEAGSAEFWGIYGRSYEGTGDAPEYLATAIHDAVTPLEAVRIARQIAVETGKGFVAGDTEVGYYPKRIGIGIWPVNEFTEIAEDLTMAIHEQLDDTIDDADRRDDDFDNHPLAELREALVEFSDYSGSDQRDPYQPLEALSTHGVNR